MCFSATASFTASSVLGVAGIYSLTQANTPQQKPFAAIPLIFSVQQLAEGILWVSLPNGGPAGLLSFCTYFFMAIAYVIWPWWVPFSIRLLEKDKKRKDYLMVLLVSGALLSVFLLCRITYLHVWTDIENCHIKYIIGIRDHKLPIVTAFYVIVTITPIFISSVRGMKWFGSLIFISCLITGIFYKGFGISLWCFFAAVVSIVVIFVLRSLKTKPDKGS